MDFNNINFEDSGKVQKTTPIDFEDFEEPQKTDWIDFESSGKITLPDIAKKEEISGPKLGPIVKSAIQATKKIFQSELPKEDPRLYGIPKEAGEPISTITGKPLPTTEEEAAAGKTVMSLIPYAFASFTRGAIPPALETAIMQPMTKLITGHDYVSPITEAQRVSGERLPKAAQEVMGIPAQMAGAIVPLSVAFKTADAALKTIGLSAKAIEGTPLLTQLTYHIIKGGTAGGIYGGIAEGTPEAIGKDAALFALIEGVLGTAAPAIRKISKSNWYRRLSIKERGLVTEKIAKQYREGMTEADVLRFLGEESKTYKTAMMARGIKVVPQKEPIKVDEPIITEPLKPTVKPTTELGRKLQAAMQAEKKPSVIAGLAKRELEIKKAEIPTPMTTISEETTNLASVKTLPSPMRAFGMREKPIEPVTEPAPTEPKTDVALEPVGAEIPTFKSTQEAYAFGEKATPEQVDELKRLSNIQNVEYEKFKKAGKLQEAMDAAVKGQFYHEALQKVEGTEEYKKFKPEKAVAVEKIEKAEVPEIAKPKLEEKYGRFLERVGKRLESEAIGQDILDTLEEKKIRPANVSKTFWEDTFFKLPSEAQNNITKYLQSITGMKPGDVIATLKGKEIKAKDWFDIAKMLGDDFTSIEYLEGTERGYIALMAYANEQIKIEAAKPQPSKLPKAKPSEAVTEEIKGEAIPEVAERVTGAFARGAKPEEVEKLLISAEKMKKDSQDKAIKTLSKLSEKELKAMNIDSLDSLLADITMGPGNFQTTMNWEKDFFVEALMKKKPKTIPESTPKPEKEKVEVTPEKKEPWNMSVKELAEQEGDWYKGKQYQIPRDRFKMIGIERNYVKKDGELHYVLANGEIGGELEKELYESKIQSSLKSHRYYVEKAIKEGKTIPPEVLKDYPDLKLEKPTGKAKEPAIDVIFAMEDFPKLTKLLPKFKSGEEFSKINEAASRWGKAPSSFSVHEIDLMNDLLRNDVDSINFVKLGKMAGKDFKDKFGKDFFEFWQQRYKAEKAIFKPVIKQITGEKIEKPTGVSEGRAVEYIPSQEKHIKRYVPITRKEADDLFDKGAASLVARFNVRGPETTGEEGYYMRSPDRKAVGYSYSEEVIDLYEKYKERHGGTESGVSITSGKTKQRDGRFPAGVRDEKAFATKGITDISTFEERWESKGVKNEVYESSALKNKIVLSKVIVPKGERGKGIGAEYIEELSAYADSKGKTIALTPSVDFGGTSVLRLKKFYKRFGFVENKGRNRDYAISETMYRRPKLFATKATKPQDTITRADLKEIFSKMKNVMTGQDKEYSEKLTRVEVAEVKIQQKKDNVEFFNGFPAHKFPKAAKGLAKLYDDHVGLPIWNYVSETLPEKAGKRFELIDRINKGIIFDYRKDLGFIEVRDDTLFKIQRTKEEIKELSEAIGKFSSAEQIRIAQIISGSITSAPKRYEKAFEAIKQFQKVEKDLIELGLMGEDNRFRQLTRKEIATNFKEIKAIDDKIKTLQKKLKPIIKTSKVVKQVSDDISEEIISTTTDTTTGLYETKITKVSKQIEERIKEAILSRGFAEGEATQMIARLKESVVPLEGKKGTLKEIKTTVKSVVTKTIIQEIEKLKTYTPSMMARARGSLVRDINKEIKKRSEIVERISLHYKMSGKLYLKRAYEKIESEKGFLSKLMGYVSKRPRLIKGYDIRRKDLSYLYRKKLGEIKRAPYLVYKGLSSETHDVFMMQMFNKVAANKNWTISPQQLAVINSGKNEKLIIKYKGFKPLPVTPKLGKLSGQLVDPYIWDDLNQAVVVTNDMIKAWDSVLRLWKTGKVVYNPATQCRNMLSNIILADWGGLPPHRIDIYVHAAKEMLLKGEYWIEAKKTPLLGTEWAGAEIKQFLKDTSKLKEGNMFARASETIKGLLDVPGKTYQGIEQFFKLAVFINERKAGRTIKQASAHAEKTIFNYLKIPPAVRWAKRWYSPFITFSSKALPRFAETVIRKPWKLAKYGIMMLTVEEITRRMNGESEEEVEQEKKVLPDYMRKSVLPGQFSHLRIPYRDKYGRSKYLDLSFILPWGDIAEQWGQSHLVGRPFLPSHPFYISVAEVAFNEILFTGQELTAKDIDVGSEYWKKIGKQFWRQAVPSLAGSYSYNKLMAAYKGEVDWAMRDRSLTEAIFDVFFGLKVRSIDYTESRGRKLKYLRGRINIIKERFKKDYNKILFDPTPDRDWNEKRTIRLYRKMNTQIDKILEKITEIESETNNKTSLKSLIPGMVPWKAKKKPA